MNRIEKRLQQVKQRMVISVGAFVLFLLTCIIDLITPGMNADASFFMRVVPFVGAVFVLPQNTSPGRWPKAETPEEQDRLDMLREDLRMLQSRVTNMRIGYLLSLPIMMLLLPYLGT